MNINNELLSPCGLYCGVCGVLIAHRENSQKFKEKLSTVYGVSADEIRCKGCMSDEPFVFCRTCPIKTCAKEKGYTGCHECSDFPCEHINNFPVEVGKKVILRAVPRWREVGTEKWVEEEEQRYICPECGNKLFRGAKRCRNCRQPVDAN